MFSMFSKKPTYSYTSLSEGEPEPHDRSSNISSRFKPINLYFRFPQWLYLSFCSFLLLLLGFAVGSKYAQHSLRIDNPLLLETKPRLFEHVPLYGDRPSNESDTVWDALMPKRGGFFTHPKIAPKRSAYAVFHQLHCLNALREAYWTTLDAATSPVALSMDDIPFEISPRHMSHCIDLLRQALMCTPDLTVEVKNLTLGGVTGFGTVHQCRSWHQLMHWVEEWEDVGAPTHKPGEGGHGHGHHHGSS